MSNIKSISVKINEAIAACHQHPEDHRRWKKLLRLCCHSVRTIAPGKANDPCLTTAVDSAARKSVRIHRRKFF